MANLIMAPSRVAVGRHTGVIRDGRSIDSWNSFTRAVACFTIIGYGIPFFLPFLEGALEQVVDAPCEVVRKAQEPIAYRVTVGGAEIHVQRGR